jgi:hypothetical protein
MNNAICSCSLKAGGHQDDAVGGKILPFGVGFMQVQAPRKKIVDARVICSNNK